MSQKQQPLSTNKYSQALKGRERIPNDPNSGGGQSQGDKSGACPVTKTDSPKVNTHTGKTIRTQELKQKVVFKAVLDSPPDVSIKDQNEILDTLCETLSVIGDYNRSVKSQKRKSNKNKAVEVEHDDDEASKIKRRPLIPPPPPIRSNIYLGLNEVTKYLERMTDPQIRSRFNHNNHLSNDNLVSTNPDDQRRSTLNSISQTQEQCHPSLEMIFICRADLPPQFYSHFPTMCCIAGGVLLVPLPLGASKRISDAVNIKRVSCIGVKTNSLEFRRIYRMVREKVKLIDVPWLSPLKPSENLLKKRKITDEELEKETSTSSLSSNMIKQKVDVEIATSLHTTKSPSIFIFKQQPKVKIEPISTQQIDNYQNIDITANNHSRKKRFKTTI
ncbi:17549_t:CDS:2 [Funneliformis geosporum]|nr:17549_t:CDS:2 [Funneliformis geosporum]